MTRNRHGMRAVAMLALVCAGMVAAQPAPKAKSWDDAQQAVVVTTSGWNAVNGKLQRFERSGASGEWKPVGEAIRIVVGHNGMAWGTGLEGSALESVRAAGEPVKKEGDGRSPAGIFRLGQSFGYAAQPPTGWKLPYVPLTATVECVDDANSKYYNQVLDRGSVKPDWNSAEQMRRADEQYRWGIIVEHNADPIQSGKGSCIFLHIWEGPETGTAGCTAMQPAAIEQLQAWLDPKKQPVLIQMPAENYAKAQAKLKLPKHGNLGAG